MAKSRFTSKVSAQIESEGMESPMVGDSTTLIEDVDTIDTSNISNDVSINSEYKETAPVKMVKVKLNCNHRCSFGGEWWDFEKGKSVNVPVELKKTLMEAGLLMPL